MFIIRFTPRSASRHRFAAFLVESRDLIPATKYDENVPGLYPEVGWRTRVHLRLALNRDDVQAPRFLHVCLRQRVSYKRTGGPDGCLIQLEVGALQRRIEEAHDGRLYDEVRQPSPSKTIRIHDTVGTRIEDPPLCVFLGRATDNEYVRIERPRGQPT
jgi:hypothetical protein